MKSSLVDAVRGAIASATEGLRVALIATVIEYDSSAGTATLAPSVPVLLPDGEAEAWPRLYGVPVAFAGSPTFQLSYALPRGTCGLVIFHDLPLDGWKVGDSEPRGRRSHALADGVFYPGLGPANARELAEAGALMVVGSTSIDMQDDRITVEAREVKLGASAADGVVRKSDLQAAIGDLKAYVDACIVAHTHSVTSFGTSGPGAPAPVPPPPPSPAQASNKVKAE